MKQSKKRTALYCRVALADPLGMERQRQSAQCIAEQFSEQTNVIFEDNGYSGLRLDRPAFQQLLYEIENERVHCIVVTEISRLFRSYQLMKGFLALCQTHSVVIYTSEGQLSFDELFPLEQKGGSRK